MSIESTSKNASIVTPNVQQRFEEITKMDGKKGISSQEERNELARLLSGTSLEADKEFIFREINEFDLKELKKGGNVRDFVKSAIEGALKLVKGGDNNSIDDEIELNVLEDIIKNADGQYTKDEVKYAILTKELRTSSELKLKLQNKALKCDNEELLNENKQLTIENEKLTQENKNLKEKLNAIKQAKQEAQKEKEMFKNIQNNLTNEANNAKNPDLKKAIQKLANNCNEVINDLDNKESVGKAFEDLQKTTNDSSKYVEFVDKNYSTIEKVHNTVNEYKKKGDEILNKFKNMQLKDLADKEVLNKIMGALFGIPNVAVGAVAKVGSEAVKNALTDKNIEE